MKIGLEYSEWSRPVAGFEWQDGKVATWQGLHNESNDLEETRFLVWRTAERLVYRYHPLLDYPTLYQTFASLEPTDENFLKFANTHGGLGVAKTLSITGTDSNGHPLEVILGGNPRCEGEPRWRWRHEHLLMRAVTGILTAIQNQDINALKQRFSIHKDGVRYEDATEFGLGYAWVCSTKMELKEWLWKWGLEGRTEADRIIRFASGWVQEHINTAMSESGPERQALTSARVILNTDRNALRLHIIPDTLLAAMWLQCARVLTENPTFKVCEHCGKWFELSPDTKRRQSKYCEPRCKVAAYRIRKAGGETRIA